MLDLRYSLSQYLLQHPKRFGSMNPSVTVSYVNARTQYNLLQVLTSSKFKTAIASKHHTIINSVKLVLLRIW